MAIDDTVNQVMNEKPGLLYRAWKAVKNTASGAYDTVKYGALAAALVIGANVATSRVEATPVNPLTAVGNSSPIDTIPIDTATYGYGTGAGGNILSNTWFASTSDGWLLKYDGKTFQNAIDTGYQLTGVDVRPDGTLVLSHNKSLEIGTVSGNTWNPTSTITLYGLTSDITDVSEGYGLADFFVASGNGDYAIRNGALGEKIDGSTPQALDVVLLDSSKYTSNLIIGEAQGYKNIDNNGSVFGPGKLIDLNLDDSPFGLANLKNYQVVVGNTEAQFFNPQVYYDGIQVPEPCSLLLVALGGMGLLTRRKEENK